MTRKSIYHTKMWWINMQDAYPTRWNWSSKIYPDHVCFSPPASLPLVHNAVNICLNLPHCPKSTYFSKRTAPCLKIYCNYDVVFFVYRNMIMIAFMTLAEWNEIKILSLLHFVFTSQDYSYKTYPKRAEQLRLCQLFVIKNTTFIPFVNEIRSCKNTRS